MAPTVGLRAPPRLLQDGSGPRALQGGGGAAIVEERTGPMATSSSHTAPRCRRGGSSGRGGSGWRRCLEVSIFCFSGSVMKSDDNARKGSFWRWHEDAGTQAGKKRCGVINFGAESIILPKSTRFWSKEILWAHG